MKKATISKSENGIWCVSYQDWHLVEGKIITKVRFRHLKEARKWAEGFNVGFQKGQRELKAIPKD